MSVKEKRESLKENLIQQTWDLDNISQTIC